MAQEKAWEEPKGQMGNTGYSELTFSVALDVAKREGFFLQFQLGIDLPLLLKKNEFPLPKDRVNLSCNFFLENPKSDLPGAPGFEDGRLFLFSPLFLPLDLPTHSFHSLVSPLPEQESACFVT